MTTAQAEKPNKQPGTGCTRKPAPPVVGRFTGAAERGLGQNGRKLPETARLLFCPQWRSGEVRRDCNIFRGWVATVNLPVRVSDRRPRPDYNQTQPGTSEQRWRGTTGSIIVYNVFT